jgi:hypothetical protein
VDDQDPRVLAAAALPRAPARQAGEAPGQVAGAAGRAVDDGLAGLGD